MRVERCIIRNNNRSGILPDNWGSRMNITKKEVEHVAKLARLALRDEEIDQFSQQLSDILTYAGKLNELNTNDVEPTSHVLPVKNIMREDKVSGSIEREKALINAPDRTEEFFRVPKVIENA